MRDSDEAAFNFYDRESGKSVRLAAAVMPEGLSREEKRDFILTAPLDEVFTQTPVRFEAPPDLPPKKKRYRGKQKPRRKLGFLRGCAVIYFTASSRA